MMPSKIIKILVVTNTPEQTISVPGRTGTNELSVCSSQGEECGVVEVFCVWDEVEFVGKNALKRWVSDCVGLFGKASITLPFGQVIFVF